MRIRASAKCLTWIPPEAIEGLFKLPFATRVAHYDAPPPNASPDVDALLARDAIRFANELTGRVEVQGERIVDYEMSGRGRLGSTRVRLGPRGMTFAGVALPELVEEPTVGDDGVTFAQTAGGHTGVPMPRAVPHAPFWRLSAPLAWSTLSLTIRADGSSECRIADASAFPRHYLYDADGRLTHKTALIRYKDWLRHADHRRSPWGGSRAPVPVASLRSAVERSLADSILMSGASLPEQLPAGGRLRHRGRVESARRAWRWPWASGYATASPRVPRSSRWPRSPSPSGSWPASAGRWGPTWSGPTRRCAASSSASAMAGGCSSSTTSSRCSTPPPISTSCWSPAPAWRSW